MVRNMDHRLMESMLRWFDHMIKMDDGRTMKIFVSELVLKVLEH